MNGLALWRWFIKHLPDKGKNSVIGMGGMVKKPRLQALRYLGRASVYIGMSRMVNKPHLYGLIYFRTMKLYKQCCLDHSICRS